jgi:hypothetical protein
MSLMASCRTKQDEPPAEETYQTEFYENYHKVAREYDKEFLRNHKEDLNTILVFVSTRNV